MSNQSKEVRDGVLVYSATGQRVFNEPSWHPPLTADNVVSAIMQWPGKYEEELSGRVFQGMPVSEVPKQLLRCGWKNVSHLDESDFREMGLGIVTARYIGGVRPKRFCRVVVAKGCNE